MRYFILVSNLVLFLFFSSCKKQNKEKITALVPQQGIVGLIKPEDTVMVYDIGLKKLSDYGFFKIPLNGLEPAKANVIPYEMNSPLFTDYAFKKRFITLPENKTIKYTPKGVLDFPKGTILIKNFYYTASELNLVSNKLIETRLLIKDTITGKWNTLPYIWNEAQTEAYLYILGKDILVTRTNESPFVYSVPNINMCKNCHIKDKIVTPLGPSARQLNRDNPLIVGNQLDYMIEKQYLEGLSHASKAEKLPNYAVPSSGTLNKRARAYLDVNCAHCHQEGGSAKTSGLHLNYDVTNEYALGINKPPVAAGKGSGNLSFDIVKGKPEQSILLFRMKHLEPDIVMPEIGKNLLHKEGIKLIEDWIASL